MWILYKVTTLYPYLFLFEVCIHIIVECIELVLTFPVFTAVKHTIEQKLVLLIQILVLKRYN